MKSISKKLLTILTICIFCVFALGSGSAKVDQEIKNDDKPNETSDSSNELKKEVPTIEEQVLFEEKGIKVTAKEIKENWLGPELKVLIENNSDKNITLSLDSIAINDYMSSAFLYEQVSAGMKSNATFDIYSSKLSDAGIKNIGKISLYFEVTNSDNYKTIYESDEIVVKTSLYEKMDKETDITGKELANKSGVRIIGKGISNDSIWGSGVVLFVENTSEREILLTSDNISVNGFMVTGYLYSTVKPGKKCIDTILLSSTDMEDNDIESIEEIILNLEVSNAKNWDTIYKTGDIKLEIE